MGLALCALRLAASARGRISWKASPLRTAMGRHLARKSTKPATAIKFNTSSTLTLLSEAIKHARPALSPDLRPIGLWRGAGQPGPCEPHTRERLVRVPATPGPTERMLWQRRRLREQGAGGKRNRSHGSPGCAEVLPEMPAYSTAHGPLQAPWLLGGGPGARGLSSAPASGSPLAFGPPGVGLRSQRTSRASGRAEGAAPAPGRDRSAGALLRACRPPAGYRAAPRAAQSPLQSAGDRRGARPAVFSQGPASRGGCLCSAHQPAPSRRAEGRKAGSRRPHPRGSAVTLKSQ